jgi:hypothetical protein
MSALAPSELQSIRDLCREFDVYMAREREGERSKIVRKAHVPPPEPEPPAADDAPWRTDEVMLNAHGYVISHERQARRRELQEAVDRVTSERGELERQIAELRRSHGEMRGRVDVLTTLLAGRAHSDEKSGAEIVDLPA